MPTHCSGYSPTQCPSTQPGRPPCPPESLRIPFLSVLLASSVSTTSRWCLELFQSGNCPSSLYPQPLPQSKSSEPTLPGPTVTFTASLSPHKSKSVLGASHTLSSCHTLFYEILSDRNSFGFPLVSLSLFALHPWFFFILPLCLCIYLFLRQDLTMYSCHYQPD